LRLLTFINSVFSFVYSKRFGKAGLGFAPHGLVQSNPVWCCSFWCFACEFKM